MCKHKIAYMISAYTEPKSLCALVNVLDTEGVDFYIHIDKKSNIAPFFEPLKNRHNVKFAECRVEVNWGGWSQIEMQKVLICEVLESPFEYQKVVNLTGTDFPIVSNNQLVSTLSSETEEFIIGYRLAMDETDCKDKVLYYYEYDKGKNIRLFWAAIRKILKIKRFKNYNSIGYDFYFGSEYWALSYNVLSDLMVIWNEDVTLQKILRHASIPSEIWIHTLFFNSKYASRGTVFDKQYEGLSKLAPLTYFVYKEAIKILTEDDYKDIMESGKMFARKVITGKSDDLIKRLSCSRSNTLT